MHFGLRESAQYVQLLSNIILYSTRGGALPTKEKMFAHPGTIYSFGIIETPLFIISGNKTARKVHMPSINCDVPVFFYLTVHASNFRFT